MSLILLFFPAVGSLNVVPSTPGESSLIMLEQDMTVAEYL